uniref:Ig-like domain-containing protein n=1 Tax=Anas platyrhynchos platyrhynchos TaxID=8840 RepID=A0A493TGG3_ANAPP
MGQCLELAQGIAWGSGMGKLCGALHGSIAQECCTEYCVGTLHRAGKRGSPTTDPIPIPAPAQPQVRIIPVEMGNARVPVRLSCHIWGFYPPEVTVIWLHNRDIVEPDDYNPISSIPNGDWSYQTQVSLLVAPVAGDTYTCSVQHVSLQEPLLEDWSPGLMPEVTILVALATVLMVLGLGLFLAGVYHYKARPPAPGECPGRAGAMVKGDEDSAHSSSPPRRLHSPPWRQLPRRQHLRTPRRTPPGTGGSWLAPSQTRCRGADNKDAPKAPLVSLQSSGHRAEAHTLLRCLTKRSGWVGAMAWEPKGKGSSRSARPAAASPRALHASVGTAADEGRQTVREPPREGYEDGEGSAGQGV